MGYSVSETQNDSHHLKPHQKLRHLESSPNCLAPLRVELEDVKTFVDCFFNFFYENFDSLKTHSIYVFRSQNIKFEVKMALGHRERSQN